MARFGNGSPARSADGTLPGVTRAAFDDAAAAEGFTLDPAQREVIERLMARPRHGIYLWGPVGRGKSWIARVWFDAIATPRKRRVHFHEFFQQLHRAIIAHGNSIDDALDALLGEVDVLCFDEFHVHDIGDSTFVRRMLLALFDRPILLVITSNYPPDGLLPNPLFHDTFVPTIELITEKLDVVESGGERDYRQDSGHAHGFSAGSWVSPGTPEQYREFASAAACDDRFATKIEVHGRQLRAARADETLLWFRFADLCDAPTASSDYLELAARYPNWLISGIPTGEELGAAPAQRFANLIDVLYDQRIPATFIATGTVEELAAVAHRSFDLDRILSRLSSLRQRTQQPLH